MPGGWPHDARRPRLVWDHFRTAWEGAVERAQLVDFHFHDLRHTFASWDVQRGASLQEVKDLLRITRWR